MSLSITSLNSGSNGNCYYIGNETEAVLIDAGISCRETERRMRLLGLSMNTVKAIFISHEHADHINGLTGLTRKYSLPVYITNPTLQNCNLPLNRELVQEMVANNPVAIGSLSVTPFPKHHDAADPHSFIISHNSITIGVFTDIGVSCGHVTKYFSQCHAAFLEANFDEQLLEKGKYPRFLKDRIRGGKGHLSNNQALEIFTKHRPSFMTHLFLSHLSKDNNDPVMVQQLFEEHAEGIQVIVASRYVQTAVYSIQKETGGEQPVVSPPNGKMSSMQLSLF